MKQKIIDVIIIGGGPAGMSAAIVLGRCLRNVLLFDNGHQRNRASHGIHNFITRDNVEPDEFIDIAKKEMIKYGVQIINEEIIEGTRTKDKLFQVKDSKHRTYTSRKLLVASGLRDIIPPVPGMLSLYGRFVFHCPYCDGWEVKNKKIAVYACNKNGYELALSLLTWSKEVTLYCDGNNYLKASEKQTLQKAGIEIIEDRIKSLEEKDNKLTNVILANETKKQCDAVFFVNGYEQQSKIMEGLGCVVNKKGTAISNRKQQTNIPGLYVAGDVSRDVHFVIVAASEGAKAGVCINQELQKEEADARSTNVIG